MRNATRLIGLSGFARSGKDTAFFALWDRGFVRRAFADALKADVRASLDRSLVTAGLAESETQLFGDDYKERFRPLLVEYGRAMRLLVKDYWIKRLARDNFEVLQKESVGITDVRYANEADWIHEQGGKVILIQRPGVGAANSEEEASIAEMKSKFCFDAIIDNDSTVEALHAKVLQYLDETTQEK